MYKLENIKFEPLSVENILLMQNWGYHMDPLFADYNINIRDIDEAKYFLRSKTLMPFNRYFAIFYLEEMIGFVGLKRINPITKTSVLGLVLNPSLVGRGLGSISMRQFLEYYFTELKMEKMILDVATYNTRAIRLYKRLGFRKIKKGLYPTYLDPEDKSLEEYQDLFVNNSGRWYVKGYRMELTKEEYLDI